MIRSGACFSLPGVLETRICRGRLRVRVRVVRVVVVEVEFGFGVTTIKLQIDLTRRLMAIDH